MGLYPIWAIAAAIALYIIHRIQPYQWFELRKFPYDDPPPKVFGSFTLGELIQYLIQVFLFPIAVYLAVLPCYFLHVPKEITIIVEFIVLGVWALAPKWLAKKIDGW